MSALTALPATGTPTGLDVELGDDGDDGREIGLVLDDDFRIHEGDLAVRADTARHGKDAIDAFGGRRGSEVGRVPSFAARFFLAFFEVAAAEMASLAMRL